LKGEPGCLPDKTAKHGAGVSADNWSNHSIVFFGKIFNLRQSVKSADEFNCGN
jgi:hypothetical protein